MSFFYESPTKKAKTLPIANKKRASRQVSSKTRVAIKRMLAEKEEEEKEKSLILLFLGAKDKTKVSGH